MSSAQNRPYAKVVSSGETCSEPLQSPRKMRKVTQPVGVWQSWDFGPGCQKSEPALSSLSQAVGHLQSCARWWGPKGLGHHLVLSSFRGAGARRGEWLCLRPHSSLETTPVCVEHQTLHVAFGHMYMDPQKGFSGDVKTSPDGMP